MRLSNVLKALVAVAFTGIAFSASAAPHRNDGAHRHHAGAHRHYVRHHRVAHRPMHRPAPRQIRPGLSVNVR